MLCNLVVNAKDDATLKTALDDALRVPYEVRDSAGAVVGAGRVGDQPLALPEGHYTVAVQTAEREILIRDVRVTAAKDSRIELKKEGREVGVKVNQP